LFLKFDYKKYEDLYINPHIS